MFGPEHYVPVLKGKRGEFDGITEIEASKKTRFTPLIEIPSIPWDFVSDGPSKRIDDYLSPFPNHLLRSWGHERPIFIDLNLIPDSERMPDGAHPLAYLVSECWDAGVHTIPVTGLGRDDVYQKNIRTLAERFSSGACLRLQGEFLDEGLDTQIEEFLRFINLDPNRVDLIVDLGHLPPISPIFIRTVRATLSELPRLSEWRSFVLSSSAFPEDLSEIRGDTTDHISRDDWRLWSGINNNRGTLSRMPTFGDYAIAHPESPDLDPRIIRPSASIRYSADDYWLIVKGRGVRTDAGFGQFRQLCRDLIERPEYRGPEFSWGDRFIRDCAGGEGGTGNLTTWRKVGTNHHIELVIDQIANLTEP